MITIEIIKGGKAKRYTARGVNLRASLDGYDLYREYGKADGDYSAELLDKCAAFVCRIFGNAFSVDDLMAGYMGSAFRLYPSILNAVVGYSNETIANFPEPAMAPVTGAETTT